MILQIQLTTEEERRIQHAKDKGIDFQSLIHTLIAQLPPPQTPEERASEFLEWVNQPRPLLPSLSEDDMSRESIYAERG